MPAVQRFEFDPNVAVLTLTTGLPDELALHFDGFRDRFFVGHLRLADVGFDFEFALEAIQDDLEMKLAHAADDRLLGLFVGPHTERRIFLRQARERDAEFVLIALRLRLDGLEDDGLREHDILEQDRVFFVAERVAGARVGHADGRRDVARADRVDIFAMVSVHPQNAADALFLTGRALYTYEPFSSTPE